MKSHELVRNRPFRLLQERPDVASAQCGGADNVWMLHCPISHPADLPYRMASEVIILFAIREQGCKYTTFSSSEATVVEKLLFPERPGRPAHHASGCHGHPVDAASPVRDIAADLLKALAT